MAYYYRRPVSFFGIPMAPMTKKLIIINVVVFILQMLFLNRFVSFLGLVPVYAVTRGMLWQFVTYLFLHGSFLHLFFNMFALWMFGSEIERHWSPSEFLKYYLFTGIGAGITTCVFTFPSYVHTIGASGAIFGILLAYGMAFPDRLVYVWFLIPIRAKYVAIIFGALELLFIASPGGDGIARFAHLGGLLFGYVYLKRERLGYRIRRTWTQSTRRRRLRLVERRQEEETRKKERIDAILDKISREGIDSLTDRERDILRRAGQRRY